MATQAPTSEQPVPEGVPRPGRVSFRAALAALLAAIAIVLATIPVQLSGIRTDHYDCGTVWTWSGDWRFKSEYADQQSLMQDYGAAEGTKLATDSFTNNLQAGKDLFAYCGAKHHDREVLLSAMAGAGVAMLAVSVVLRLRSRRQRRGAA
jgi:hypothetical protein